MAALGREDAVFMAADNAFHVALAAAAGNPLFVELVERVQAVLAPAIQALPESRPWHRRSVDEHAVVLAAVEEGNADAGRAAMAAHLAATEQAVEFLLTTLLDAKS